MDDKHIEDLLRDSWKPCSPDGMRGRVLRSSRRELVVKQPRIFLVHWRFALVGLAVLVILLTNFSEFARQGRLSTLVNGGAPPGHLSPIDLRERQRLIGELSAKSISDDPFPYDMNRKKQL